MFRSEHLPIGYSIPKGYKRKRPAGSPTNIRLKKQNQKELPHLLLLHIKRSPKGRQQQRAQVTTRHVQTLQTWFASWRRYKVCNKNNVKLSYSCMPNMAAIISRHNKALLVHRTEPVNTVPPCNCRAKTSCPMKSQRWVPRGMSRDTFFEVSVSSRSRNPKVLVSVSDHCVSNPGRDIAAEV